MTSSSLDRRQFIKVAGAAAAAAALPGVARAAEANRHARNAGEEALRTLSDVAEEGGRLRLGPPGSEAAACCGRTSRTTGRSPSRTSAATSTRRTSRKSAGRSTRAVSARSGSSRSTSSSRTTTTARPWGADQSIAIFGKPGDKFEMVMTGRHMTVRADGNSIDSMAFGGPVFHGHAARPGFNEKVGHPRQHLLAAGRSKPTRSTRCSTASSAEAPSSPQLPGRAVGRLPRQRWQIPRHRR